MLPEYERFSSAVLSRYFNKYLNSLQRSHLRKKTCVFYAEKNFQTQFADKTAFRVRTVEWVLHEVEIACALILTEHNKLNSHRV